MSFVMFFVLDDFVCITCEIYRKKRLRTRGKTVLAES